jgi:hypothetical protein
LLFAHLLQTLINRAKELVCHRQQEQELTSQSSNTLIIMEACAFASSTGLEVNSSKSVINITQDRLTSLARYICNSSVLILRIEAQYLHLNPLCSVLPTQECGR